MIFASSLLLVMACSETGMTTFEQQEDLSWFEKTSREYQEGFTPAASSADTGLADSENDPGSDWPEAGDPNGCGDEIDDDNRDDRPEEEPEDPDDGTSSDDADCGYPPDEPGAPSTPATAASPAIGQAVITELMIHPQNTDDALGEWIEIFNASSAWLNFEGVMLADSGVDGVEIEASGYDTLIVAPGEYLVLCATDDYWDNGGVDCDGTFYYWTMGGGFALANLEDEVKIISATGWLIDEVRYTDGFSVEGAAMGLRSDSTTTAANDVRSNWCEQYTMMTFGDAGTPGQANDGCW
jgi:hypothetical protein